MIEEWTSHKAPSPWGGLSALMLFALVLLIAFLLLSSCATLNRIPFSVSYQLQDGSSVTFTKPRIITEK